MKMGYYIQNILKGYFHGPDMMTFLLEFTTGHLGRYMSSF